MTDTPTTTCISVEYSATIAHADVDKIPVGEPLDDRAREALRAARHSIILALHGIETSLCEQEVIDAQRKNGV